MDRIVASYVKDFADENGLVGIDESELFEHFANYCVISRDHPEPFELDHVHLGGSSDTSIDGIAILVNEHLVQSEREIDFFKKSLRRLDVHFLFVQAKTSEKFDMGDIGNFIHAVRDFFENKPPRGGPQIERLWKLKEYIYDASIDMSHTPQCTMYYMTTGKWLGDDRLKARIDADTAQLRNTDLFSKVLFVPLDAEAIRRLYRELRHKIEKEMVFEKHTILPSIENVQEAYIGIVPCIEYVKLISDEDGRLRRSLFYDNVRDFQGNNPVNTEIKETINDLAQSDRFALLNNGVTIVAKSVNKVGATFKLRDFQIVNGCQTSHVLHMQATALTDRIYLPVKLIVTDDVEVTNHIIKATNRQTEVKVEAFESLSPFQKKLEEFYVTVGKSLPERLYYERRSKQYEALPIKKHQIVTLPVQISAFIAMFLNEPHSTHRYYGELLKSYGGRIFLENHSPFPYFMTAYGLVVLEQLFFQQKLSRAMKRFKYQMLMLFRLTREPFDLPFLNSHKIDSYCESLMEALSKDQVLTTFREAEAIITETLRTTSLQKFEAERLRAFTAELVDKTKRNSTAATVQRERGKVSRFSAILGWGFIERAKGSDLFVHYSGIRGEGYRSLAPDQRVEFTIVETDKGPQAQDVVLIESGD